MTKRIFAVTMVLGISGTLLAANGDARGSAQRTCRVQGVWERVATLQSGKRQEYTDARQRKVVTKKHHMWLNSAARRDTLPLRTTVDTLNFYWVSGGSGTYEVAGSRYTEHLDMFTDPRLEGKKLTASCRVDGNRWYHTFLPSDIDSPAPGQAAADSITEVWRRVE
jgi:hypothetical protein